MDSVRKELKMTQKGTSSTTKCLGAYGKEDEVLIGDLK